MLVFFLWGFLLLVLILLFQYIKIQITVELLEENDRRLLKIVTISPIKNSSKEYSLEKLGQKISELFFAQKASEKTNRKNSTNEPVNFPGEDSGLGFFLDSFQQSGSIKKYCKISQMYLKYLLVENLDWRTVIGMNDAMKTAIASGSLWALKGVIVSQLSNKSRVEKLFLHVAPNFASNILLSRINCILKMRMVHIILIRVYYYGLEFKTYLKSVVQG